MDDSRAADAPHPIAPTLPDPLGAPPNGFTPLRLVLQPTGDSVELTRVHAVVGRHSDADVRLPLPDVSRRHCRLAYLDGYWHLHDLKSLNGTFLNNQMVDHALVRHGDILRIGGFTFEVDLAGTRREPADRASDDNVLLSITRALPSARAG